MIFELLNALGGVALILFGVRFLRKGLSKLVGPKLPLWVSRLTGGAIRTAATGIGVGLLAPSTSSQGLLAVSLVRDGTLGLKRGIVLLMGAYLGATLLLHIVALDISSHAPIGVLAGVALFQGVRSRALRGFGQLILSVSFVLLGVELIGGLATSMGGSQDLRDIVRIVENYPLIAAMLAAAIAAMVQSSTATLAVFLGFALHDGAIVSDMLIFEVVVGANVGITVLALVYGWSDTGARRFSVGVLLLRCVVAALVLAFTLPLVGLIERTPGTIAQHGATAHTLFNVLALAVAIPCAGLFGRLAGRMVKDPPDHAMGPSPIDERWADAPGVAFTQTKREIGLAVRVATSMLDDAWSALEQRDTALMDAVHERDDTVDQIDRHVRRFLTRQLTDELDGDDVRRRLLQLRYMGDLETIADVIDKRIGTSVEKIGRRGLWFCDEEWGELRRVFGLVHEALVLSGAAFAEERPALARQLLDKKDRVRDAELELRERHYTRLQQGERASIETTDLYVDLLGELKRIAHLASGVAYGVLELASQEREDTQQPETVVTSGRVRPAH